MITLFELFITSDNKYYNKKGYIKKITSNEFKSLNISLDNDKKIYRGFGDLDNGTYIINPNVINRKSANTTNYYTELINNLPLWKDFPKRQMICTTNYFTAETFSDSLSVFEIVPISNDTKIGICPTSDIWNSFKYMRNKFGLKMDIDLYYINELFEVIGLKDDYSDIITNFKERLIDIYNKNYTNLKISDYDFKFYDHDINKIMDEMYFKVFDIEKIVKELKNKTSLEFLNDAFNPIKNDFKLITYKNYKKLSNFENNEIWFDEKCIITSIL